MKTALLLAATDLLLAAGIQDLLQEDSVLDWAGVVRSQPVLEAALREREQNIVLLSLALLKDPESLFQLRQDRNVRLVLLLPPNEEPPWEHLPSFDGVVLSTANEAAMRSCLHTVARGGRCGPTGFDQKPKPASAGERVLAQLSPRQVQILTAVARGEKNAAIAQRLGTTEQVVKNLLRGIFDLTGVSDRLELALFVLHHPELSIGTGAP